VPRLAADHNFDARIVTGLLRRQPDLDILHIRDAGLATAPDPDVLEWAARERLVLLTHDRATLVGFAYERVVRGEPLGGVIVVSTQYAIGRAIDDLLLLLECMVDDEWAGRVFFIPL
jgi:predicted nuclease of predicted toxin-antitoxin system